LTLTLKNRFEKAGQSKVKTFQHNEIVSQTRCTANCTIANVQRTCRHSTETCQKIVQEIFMN